MLENAAYIWRLFYIKMFLKTVAKSKNILINMISDIDIDEER